MQTAAAVDALARLGRPRTELSAAQDATVLRQSGTLGSGNHVVEVCLDDADEVWLVLHSGSRGIGNQPASRAIAQAKGLVRRWCIELEDPGLAYLVQGTPEVDTCIADMLWAQAYAFGSRQQLMDAAQRSLFEVVGHGSVVTTINCHHDFTQREHHLGRDLWITRKGATKAGTGDEGVIPGSRGTRSFVVRGRGAAASSSSCAHGAGRRMSRARARRELTVASLTEAMGTRTRNADRAERLLDEHPDSDESIDQVMADQQDLVEVTHVLRQVFNDERT